MDGFFGNRNRSKTPYAASLRPRFLLGKRFACFSLFSCLPSGSLRFFPCPIGSFLSCCSLSFPPAFLVCGWRSPAASVWQADHATCFFCVRRAYNPGGLLPFTLSGGREPGQALTGPCPPAESGIVDFFHPGPCFPEQGRLWRRCLPESR